MAKQRIDTLLAQKALADSRDKAKVLVMAGAVYVEGQRVLKPDQQIDVNAHVEVRPGALLTSVSAGQNLNMHSKPLVSAHRGRKRSTLAHRQAAL